jgi:hypothetical protein
MHKIRDKLSIELIIKSQHISGCDNKIADTLSRWDLHDKFRRDFKQLTSDLEVIEDFVQK